MGEFLYDLAHILTLSGIALGSLFILCWGFNKLVDYILDDDG